MWSDLPGLGGRRVCGGSHIPYLVPPKELIRLSSETFRTTILAIRTTQRRQLYGHLLVDEKWMTT